MSDDLFIDCLAAKEPVRCVEFFVNVPGYEITSPIDMTINPFGEIDDALWEMRWDDFS